MSLRPKGGRARTEGAASRSEQAPRNAAGRGAGTVALLVILIAAHLAIVSSVVWQDRPIIWPLHNDTIHRAGRGADFYAVYHAGLNLRQGRNPYANAADGVAWYPFRYLPIIAVAAKPITYLSPRTTELAWAAVVEAILALLLVTLWRRIPDRAVRMAAIGLLLVNSPYFLELYMGQFTFAAVALCCLGLLLPAGSLLLCGSVLLKPLALTALPALARQRRYWSHAAWMIVCVVLASVPYFLRHPEQGRTFLLLNFGGASGYHAGNYGFVRLLQLLVDDAHLTIVRRYWNAWALVLELVALAATALLVFRSKSTSVVVGVAALMLAHFLTYRHVWEHHMSGVCVLGAMLLTTGDRSRARTIAVLGSLLLLALPTSFGLMDVAKDPSVFDPSTQWPRYASYLVVLPKVIPTLTLFVIAVADLCRDGFMSPREAMRAAFAR
jgi:glycosyl transferase family 87